jgi:hypothetical protein
MEVIEVVRSWVSVATTWMVEVLGLATREDVVELRRRVDELQAIVRRPDDELPARRATVPPRMKDSIARAGAALAGVTAPSQRSKTASPDDADSGTSRPEGP